MTSGSTSRESRFLIMDYSANYRTISTRLPMRIAAIVFALILTVICFSDGMTADAAAAVKAPAAPVLLGEYKYDTGYSHPYNAQTNQIILHWKPVSGATAYHVYIRGGKYAKYKRIGATTKTDFRVKNLDRATSYRFVVRAQNSAGLSGLSNSQLIKTARFNFDQADWEALCRITYHEVGGINTSFWDRPIVYVADCCVNRFVVAKYTYNPTWTPYYARYSKLSDIIYYSGGFMSSAGLAYDGATYSRVPERVKIAAYGACYAKTELNGIANDFHIFFWSNRSYYTVSSKIAYSFSIPWGYFYVWREYWGNT